MNNKQQRVLVVAAHADDEVLGCGATIAKHIANQDKVKVIFMTDGVGARDNSSVQESQARALALTNAMTALGVTDYQCFDFPDNQMDTVSLLSIVKEIEQVIAEFQPSIVYSHFGHDLNIDHRITHQAVMTACRPIKGHSVKKIFAFEVLSSTEWQSPSAPSFKPQYIVNISPFWPQKLQALQSYQQELRAFPHSRSLECIEALATLRGASHGFEKAEAFQVERILAQ